VRVEDPAGWPWTVRRRWLPWRPRTHRAVAALYIDVDGSNEIGFVIAVLLNIPCLLVLPVLAVEWVLLLGLLPLVVLARAAGVRFVVTARGRRQDGVRVRYEARAPSDRAWLASGTALRSLAGGAAQPFPERSVTVGKIDTHFDLSRSPGERRDLHLQAFDRSGRFRIVGVSPLGVLHRRRMIRSDVVTALHVSEREARVLD